MSEPLCMCGHTQKVHKCRCGECWCSECNCGDYRGATRLDLADAMAWMVEYGETIKREGWLSGFSKDSETMLLTKDDINALDWMVESPPPAQP